MRECFRLTDFLATVFNKQLTADSGWSSRLEIAWGWELGVPPCRQAAPYKVLHGFGPEMGSCEHSNESLGSLKGGEFLNLTPISISRRPLFHGGS
jgi:hypothetical protein